FTFYLVLFVLFVLKKELYVFLSPRLGGFSALAVLPFHFLYHFYNGISFLIGLTRHIGKGLRNESPLAKRRSSNGVLTKAATLQATAKDYSERL
ncbi:MAG: hypothetical protein JO097_05320, partial [Acidobacteriaceae bacterium]|nr:hypothetical protein [Acidobacteriaceae bacterium]